MKSSGEYDRRWLVRNEAIQRFCAQERECEAAIGGRFLCGSEQSEDVMAALLADEGLALSDTGQGEVFASTNVIVSETVLTELSEKLRVVADRHGLRLLSIEAGNPEEGRAIMLASERGYTPWWENE